VNRDSPAPVAEPSTENVAPSVSRLFASSSDETRVRRTADVVLLFAASIGFALLGWASGADGDLDRWVTDIVDGAPQWLRALATVAFTASGLAVVAVVALVVQRSRWALVRDMVAALGVTVIGASVASRWVSSEWPDVVPEITNDTPSFPVIRIALLVALLATIRPSLTVPVRTFGRWLVIAAVLASLVLGYATATTALGGIALGLASAAVVRLVFGTSIGIPTLIRVSAALAELHQHIDELAYDAEQPKGWLELSGVDVVGPVAIRLYGRDAADNAFANRVWRARWYRDAEWSLGVSRQQLAEHEALMLLLADRAGVHVPEVVGVGATSTGDAVLVTRDDGRMVLGEVDDPDDEVLDAVWDELGRLHAADLRHGHVDPTNITISASGRPGFRDLARGVMSPTPRERQLDVVELLVTTTLIVGPDRAAAAALRRWPVDDLVAALPMLQRAGLSRDLSAAVRAGDLDIDALRSTIASALGVDPPQPVKLRRVRWRDVIMTALALVAANAIIGWVASIDLEAFLDEVADASIGWLLVAFVLSQLTNVAETVSMMGVVSRSIPVGPTMQFQYATSYISLAVPSDAGRIAMTIRYLQKLGVPTKIAVGQGPFTTVFGYLIDALLLILTSRVVGTSLELPDDADFSGFVTVLTIAAIVIIGGVVAVFAIPKLRNRILPGVKETVLELKGALTDPRRATRLLGGLLTKKLLFALALTTILTAYGSPLPLATVIFVNTAVSWFAGVFPVPGGIGVAEAGFVFGLTAFGVPETVALAVALTHRLYTTYLPSIVGFFTFKRLERGGYL
jgi:uncharacterized membrane protein YbhN (UPF0104 family)/tRNA A-37 threonylcarbamoyl transferase component Bud32